MWQGQGRHPELEEMMAELCLLLCGDDATAVAAAREGFLQPLLGYLARCAFSDRNPNTPTQYHLLTSSRVSGIVVRYLTGAAFCDVASLKAPGSALVGPALETVLSFLAGAERHAAIAACLTADLAQDDDFVARALSALCVHCNVTALPLLSSYSLAPSNLTQLLDGML
jgi:hypothetical protein